MSTELSIPDALYVLDKVVDDPRFEGFGLVADTPSRLGRRSLLEDLRAGFGVSKKSRKWRQPSLRDNWVPPIVGGRVNPFNDFPGINLTLPAFSTRACNALRGVLEANGELLPLQSTAGKYFFYNITTIVEEALDLTKSTCDFLNDPPTVATNIDWFSFHKERLRGLSIFRICEWPSSVIVTDGFVSLVNSAGLNGFSFAKIWPFKRGVSWRTEAKKDFSRSKAVKGESLVLILPLQGERPGVEEGERIKSIEDRLDSLLAVASLAEPYFGSYEGSDFVGRECRLFLSCPSAEALLGRLRPFLESFDWPVAFHVMKRFGSMWDADAPESVVSIRPQHLG